MSLATRTSPEFPGSGKVSTRLKAGYSFSEIGLTAIELMLQVYLLELYLVAGLSPFLGGLALGLAALWDAVSDPLMGVISDRTKAKTAAGKRLSYFIPGVALSAVFFVFLFSPTQGSESGELFARLLLFSILLNTGLTLVNVPYLSLINDLSRTPEDRTGFFGWRLSMSSVGLLVGLAAPALFAAWRSVSLEEGGAMVLLDNRSEVSYWLAGLVCVVCAVTTFALWRPAKNSMSQRSGASGLWKLCRSAFSTREFRLVVGAFVFISMGRAFNGSLALLFYKGSLDFSEAQVAAGLIGFAVVIGLATPFWVLSAKKFGKEQLCLIGSVSLTALTAVAYPLMPPGGMLPFAIVIFLGGISVASVVLLESLFSDVIENDEAVYATELTGAYYGVWRLATKVARAGGLAVSGVFLGLIQYQTGVLEQEPFVDRAIAWAFGPGVAVFFAFGTFCVWKRCR